MQVVALVALHAKALHPVLADGEPAQRPAAGHEGLASEDGAVPDRLLTTVVSLRDGSIELRNCEWRSGDGALRRRRRPIAAHRNATL